MGDVMNQLRQLRPPAVSQPLTASVLLQAKAVLAEEDRFQQRPLERGYAVFVAALGLAHAVWTVVFMNGLAR